MRTTSKPTASVVVKLTLGIKFRFEWTAVFCHITEICKDNLRYILVSGNQVAGVMPENSSRTRYMSRVVEITKKAEIDT